MPVTPPRCKICGAAHWFSEPHAGATTKPKRTFGGFEVHLSEDEPKLVRAPKPLKAERELPPVITGAQLAESLGHHGPKARDRRPVAQRTERAPSKREAAGSSPAGPAKPPTDRKAYMRELMRAKRAKAKAAQSA